MVEEQNKSSEKKAGFDYSLQEFQNAVATLLNILYLLELEANNADHVRRYLKMTDPAMESLLRILKERMESC